MTTLVEVTLPDVGSGDKADAATVSFWLGVVGETLQAGDDLIEITSDKASFVVPCPVTGVLREKRVQEDDRINPGDVIAVIEVET